MSYINFKSEYEKHPTNKVVGHKALQGYDAILKQLKADIKKEDFILCMDAYPGVDDNEVLTAIKELKPTTLVLMKDIFKETDSLANQLKYQLGDDRVFGKMYFGEILDFIDEFKLIKAKEEVKNVRGLTIIYGFGASLVSKGDLLVYLDMARWEIQMRYRKGMGNYKAENSDEDILKKYKRAFFVEWRIADKHKSNLFHEFDYVMDTNKANDPKMITGAAFLKGMDTLANKPFRTVPYFDPGVWGGQWMKEVCNLDPSKDNYAWSFDGVPEENSVLLDFDGVIVELPAMDLVLSKPKELLGPQVLSRFGREFPIRFDFLDTFEGQSLSLQVHPLTDYIRRQFGMAYTQDESYYILDAKEGSKVYLGLKDNVDSEAMIDDLRNANQGLLSFDADKYINTFEAKKHDHYLIPSGTCHCAGSGTMTLEISATPYIFTFKLWDWDRVGLDGLPRPVHIEHGKEVIQWNRTTQWVKDNLVNDFYEVEEKDNNCKIEHTGLHELEFIETRRYTITDSSLHRTNNTVNMLNLVDGKEAIVESVNGEFEPFTVHYAETFIIPASIKEYTIKPSGRSVGEEIKVLKAYVR